VCATAGRRRDRIIALAFVAGIAASLIALPAHAQVAGSVSLDNDYRLRGYSLSGRRPVATLDLSYDHDSGVYANASASAAFDYREHVDLLAVEASIGYARRVSRTLSIDAGVARLQYRAGRSDNLGTHYTELYVGLTSARVSTHLYYSPDYLRPDVATLYGEVDATIARVEKVRLAAHIGMLTTLSAPDGAANHRTRYDWRASAARQFGPIELHAALTGGGPGRDYYRGSAHSKTAVTFGASWFF
jgi:uncharacterized protein (TIGR02001 family)